MRRSTAVLALSLAVVLPGNAHAAVQPCVGSSWVAGTTNLCNGVLVYRDYVYDDYGAASILGSSQTVGTLAPAKGKQQYPAGQVNTADLVRLELSVVGGRLQVKAMLNTLYRADSTILAMAIDTDRKSSTGGGTWPGVKVASAGWDQVHLFRSGDPRTNVIEGSMPLPSTTAWRVQAVTAQADGTVMNVAFRGPDEHAKGPAPPGGTWFEDDQAEALQTGDISRFGHDVAVADLRSGATRLASVGPGLHERVYTSDYTLPPGEGVNLDGIPGRGDGGGGPKLGFEQYFHYLGRYQPYGIYVPRGGKPYGLQFVYHGTGANMASLINFPGMQNRFGDGLDRLLVVPLVRGPDGYGSDIAERDLLDVWADVERAYPVDRDKVISSGYSQGGYIAYRMAQLFPHRFAGLVDWVGFTGDGANGAAGIPLHYTAGAVGNVLDYVPNLRNVPSAELYSGGDYLVHVSTALAMRKAFEDSDARFDFFLHPVAEHLTFALLDDWRKEAAASRDWRLARRPARVQYVYDPIVDSPAYGIRHDRAYWLSNIHRRVTARATLDVTNTTCGGRLPRTRTGSGAGLDPLPWTSTFRHAVGSIPITRQRAFSGRLTNVRGVLIDVEQTCIGSGEAGYDLTTDGPLTVCFSDGRVLDLAGAGRFQGTVRRGLPRRPNAATQRCFGSRSCMPRRLIAGSGGIGKARLRRSPTALLRQYHVIQRSHRYLHFCVRGNGRFVVGLRAGKIDLIATSARGHRAGWIRPGARLRRPPTSGALTRGLWLGRRSRQSGLVYGVRRNRVGFVAAATRRQLGRPRALKQRLGRLGFR